MFAILGVALVLVLAGCGSNGEGAEARGSVSVDLPTADARTAGRVVRSSDSTGTRISVAGSRFGRMLWGPKRQAIYIFERDAPDRTRCYGECARAWPPVYTNGRPVAGPGARQSLLASIRRRDGRRQVTYAGRPLYYYAHEGPREVLCHNVNLNGGLWWVVGADGRRRR